MYRIGDKVRVVRLDRFSNDVMADYIGSVGTVVGVRFLGKSMVLKLLFSNGVKFSWHEDSLALVKDIFDV